MNTLTASKKASCFRKHLPAFILFILTNLIFCLLYWKFIIGDNVYMYADIGNDSLSSSYPLLVLLSRLFHNGGFTSYALTDGLGTDITSLYLQYINPVKLLMLVFPTDMLPQAIMLSTFIQINLLSLFGYFFFRSLLGTSKEENNRTFYAPVMAALAWSFTAYVVLWGQNYSFLTCILMFTMLMAFIQFYLKDSKKSHYLWFIPMVGLFLISNYYFLFMSAEFAVVYVIFWGIFTRPGVRKFFKKVLELAGMALLGAIMGFISLLPIINNFLSSNRVSRLAENSASSTGTTSVIYNKSILLTFLGRLFSANTFGPGSGYTGSENYYEAAILSVSALIFFALIYLILKKKHRLKVLFVLLLSIIMLSLPKVSSIVNLDASVQRWTFMLCFAECIAIGFFIKELLTDTDSKILFRTLVVTPLLVILCLGLVWIGKIQGLYSISKKPVIFFCGFCVLYEILLFIYYLALKKKEAPKLISSFRGKTFRLSFIFILALELVVMNYMSINDRTSLSKSSFYSSYYNDGSERTAELIRTMDTDLYRMYNDRQTDPNLYGVTATADKMFANEGMVNNYNGLSVYTSTLSSSLTGYAAAYLSGQGSSNFFIVDESDYYIFTLLGGRYVFGTTYNLPLKTQDSDLFEQDACIDDQQIYKNKNALPFGYLYSSQIDVNEYKNLNALERMRLSTQGFYYTNDLTQAENGNSDAIVSSKDMAFSSVSYDETSSTLYQITDLIESSNDCEVSMDGSNITITPTGADPYIVLKTPLCQDGETLILDLSVAGNASCAIQLFSATTDYPSFSSDLCQDYTFTSDKSELVMTMAENLTQLRIDTMPGEVVTFDVATLSTINTAHDFSNLAHSDVTNISWESKGTQATYSASVKTDKTSMLCVPLTYSSNWTAYVDGEKAEVRNINGGLMGVSVSEGSHDVKLVYSVPHFKMALMISLGGCLVFIIILILSIRKDRKTK